MRHCHRPCWEGENCPLPCLRTHLVGTVLERAGGEVGDGPRRAHDRGIHDPGEAEAGLAGGDVAVHALDDLIICRRKYQRR